MNARQRMADVKQLRNDVFHGFLNMIIKPGWQQALYDIANQAMNDERGIFRDAYANAYSKMREIGVANYTVEHMDVSLIRTITSYWNSRSYRDVNFNYAPMKSQTLDALKNVKEDRNDYDGHSSGNEDEEELYLQGLLSLVNLQQLVKTIDRKELNIPDNDRLAFFQKYMGKITSLKDTLDEERIELVQKTKEIDWDIQQIKNSKDPLKTWVNIHKIYDDRAITYRDDDKEKQRLQEFCIRASDAGIQYAHSYAADYFILILDDPVEATKRLQLLLESEPNLTWQTCKSVIDSINVILIRGHEPTEELLQLIGYIKNHGHAVDERDGRYILMEWERREKERQRKRVTHEDGPFVL